MLKLDTAYFQNLNKKKKKKWINFRKLGISTKTLEDLLLETH